VLAHHREDDARTGWISGLDDKEGKNHPTVGGLRIGKQINERCPSKNYDERLEWDRDGQYYHYLTKWMHALNRVSRIMEDPSYNMWAVELAKTAHSRFTYDAGFGSKKYMYWKMSIDLSRPLVRSMGQHDPLDGYITYHQLQSSVAQEPEKSLYPDLKEEITDMTGICEGKSWITDDPLGLGGLLWDSYKVAQMIAGECFKQTDLLNTMLESSLVGLAAYAGMKTLNLAADYRLAFRELGLSIGLRAAMKLRVLIKKESSHFENRQLVQVLRGHIESLMHYTPLIETIESFWLQPASRKVNSWMDHRDINMVMMATSLAPNGFLVL